MCFFFLSFASSSLMDRIFEVDFCSLGVDFISYLFCFISFVFYSLNSMALLNVRVKRKKNPQSGEFGFILEPILYSLIDRDAILDAAQRNSQIPRSYLQQTFDALEVEMQNFVMNGHSISLSSFGTISSTLRSRGSADPDKITAEYIKQVKFHYRPSAKMRKKAQLTALNIDIPYKP